VLTVMSGDFKTVYGRKKIVFSNSERLTFYTYPYLNFMISLFEIVRSKWKFGW